MCIDTGVLAGPRATLKMWGLTHWDEAHSAVRQALAGGELAPLVTY